MPSALGIHTVALVEDNYRRRAVMGSEATTWTRIAIGGGVLMALGEILFAVFLSDFPDETIAPLVFAAAFLGGAELLRRGRVGGAVVVGMLAAAELAFLPMYGRSTTTDWVAQTLTLVFASTALGGAIGVIAQSRRRKRVAASAPA
jgi:hypothetical protein